MGDEMSEQELQLKKYVLKTYIEELLRKMNEKKDKIDNVNNEELSNLVDEIYDDINMFLDDTNRFRSKKTK